MFVFLSLFTTVLKMCATLNVSAFVYLRELFSRLAFPVSLSLPSPLEESVTSLTNVYWPV